MKKKNTDWETGKQWLTVDNTKADRLAWSCVTVSLLWQGPEAQPHRLQMSDLQGALLVNRVRYAFVWYFMYLYVLLHPCFIMLLSMWKHGNHSGVGHYIIYASGCSGITRVFPCIRWYYQLGCGDPVRGGHQWSSLIAHHSAPPSPESLQNFSSMMFYEFFGRNMFIGVALSPIGDIGMIAQGLVVSFPAKLVESPSAFLLRVMQSSCSLHTVKPPEELVLESWSIILILCPTLSYILRVLRLKK